MLNSLTDKFQGDRYIWIIIFALLATSMLVVYSATGTLGYTNHMMAEYIMLKHFGLSIFSVVFIYVAHLISYKYYSRISLVLLLISIPLLLYTIINGTAINEAKRWITLPFTDLTFQTSDLAKLALVMYVSRQLAFNQFEVKDWKKAFLPVVIACVVICGLILPNNFSTAALLFATCMIVAFVARIPVSHIAAVGGIAVLGIGLYIGIENMSSDQNRIETWKHRIESFIGSDNADYYQSDQAKIAIATGGTFGLGPGNSVQRNYLPQASSDFIYSVLIEEYGLVGGGIVLVLFLGLLYRCVIISYRSKNSFGALLVIGLGFSLVIQALVNMAVAVNLLPVTGQTLPLISMGGTSMFFTSITLGIILSVSRENEMKKNRQLAKA